MSLGTVAVVDDVSLVTKSLGRLLRRSFRKEDLDYQIVVSQRPDQVLDQVQQSHEELVLVISDIMMEPINGLDFLRSVKAQCPDALIIVLTGWINREIFTQINQELDLFSYQEKPWDDEQFIRTVKNALNLYRRKKLLNRYVPEQVVKAVMTRPTNEVLEGVELEATILSLDVRNSTALFNTKTMGPKNALKHLNRYFEHLLPIVEEYGGVLDKFMGDGMLVLFGVPFPTATPAHEAQQAVRCAWRLRQVVQELNEAEGKWPLTIGIGICTGTVIAGNVGTTHRANYTVLGQAVNTAFRLEKAIRPLTDTIFLSESTYAHVQDLVAVKTHDLIIPEKGELAAYEVVTLSDN